jgi:4-alpha-glucanotransferase
MATDRFGIDDTYHDARGAQHETSRATRAALQAAMGVEPETAAPAPDDPEAVRVLVPGGDLTLQGTLQAGADLVLEDGSRRSIDGALPEGLPFGYHRLYRRGGDETLLVVSPGRCFLPDDFRAWGFAAQLYAARSRASSRSRRAPTTRRAGATAIPCSCASRSSPAGPTFPRTCARG